jgi:hypothetical protein
MVGPGGWGGYRHQGNNQVALSEGFRPVHTAVVRLNLTLARDVLPLYPHGLPSNDEKYTGREAGLEGSGASSLMSCIHAQGGSWPGHGDHGS